MAVSDPAIADWFEANMHGWALPLSLICAVFVVTFGKWQAKRSEGHDEPKAS
jgi:hypothetical protein